MHQQEDYFALKGVWLCLQNWLCPEEIRGKKNSGSRRCNPARLILVTCKAAEKTKNKACHSSYLLNRAQISIAGHQPKQQQVCCKERRLVLAGMHTPQEWNHSPNLCLESPNNFSNKERERTVIKQLAPITYWASFVKLSFWGNWKNNRSLLFQFNNKVFTQWWYCLAWKYC